MEGSIISSWPGIFRAMACARMALLILTWFKVIERVLHVG
jgi:hypothetical protein